MKTAISLAFAFIMCISMNAQLIQDLDHIENFNEGLAAIKKGDQWAFMDQDGEIVIDFRNDLASFNDESDQITPPIFHNDRALIMKTTDNVKLYGYIDKSGNEIIKCEFVNATPFSNGFAIVMIYYKEVVGKNKVLGKDVVSYLTEEYVIDINGKALTPKLNKRIFAPQKMNSGERPNLGIKFIGDRVIAVEKENHKWDVYSF
ncbi:WG repeat-containing protein [Lutimonas halocynthiae]|uniref:WG repeat-containing protein n=1 Tax=Lutimonas halocynthiae TaxID=1446477 RepID=UPI0025B30FA0|nr:WG repeat-containing protein [Lutimonas halocynthiae]MDN3644379.1 WG repeat-containing protein [Lutimonas halocynthiae]